MPLTPEQKTAIQAKVTEILDAKNYPFIAKVCEQLNLDLANIDEIKSTIGAFLAQDTIRSSYGELIDKLEQNIRFTQDTLDQAEDFFIQQLQETRRVSPASAAASTDGHISPVASASSADVHRDAIASPSETRSPNTISQFRASGTEHITDTDTDREVAHILGAVDATPNLIGTPPPGPGPVTHTAQDEQANETDYTYYTIAAIIAGITIIALTLTGLYFFFPAFTILADVVAATLSEWFIAASSFISSNLFLLGDFVLNLIGVVAPSQFAITLVGGFIASAGSLSILAIPTYVIYSILGLNNTQEEPVTPTAPDMLRAASTTTRTPTPLTYLRDISYENSLSPRSTADRGREDSAFRRPTVASRRASN